MKRFLSLLLCITCVLLPLFTLSSCSKVEISVPLEKFQSYSYDYFDTVTAIIGYEESQEDFDEICLEIKKELEYYHKQYTIYNYYEGINNICALNRTEKGVHKELKVDECIIDLILYCKELYTQTNGKLNIAMGSVLSIWHDYRNEGMNDPVKAKLPPMDKLEEASAHMDFQKVIVNREKQTVFISDPDMTLDVGAIAKGYAVERIARYLIDKGVTGYCLNVGGNVRTIGDSQGEKWKVGVENPDTDSDEYLALLAIEDKSIVTSGNYQRFYVVEGVSYHHIIDPDTLMPCTKYTSVSVVTEDSGYADALSTSLFLMDFDEGFELVEKTEGVEVMWLMPDGEVKYSSGFKEYIE